MVKIDADKAIELIEKAVDERGEEYVDPNADPDSASRCVYAEFKWERGDDRIPRRGEFIAPGCIVGTAFHIAGVSADDLRLISVCGSVDDIQDELLSGGIRETIGSDRIEIDLEMTNEAVTVLLAAQTVQDNNGTWGEAYHNALRAYDEVTNAS